MFDLRQFIKKGFLGAVGNMPDYKIRINSATWLDKGVLLGEDLKEIENAIQKNNKKTIEEIEENEENVEEPNEAIEVIEDEVVEKSDE